MAIDTSSLMSWLRFDAKLTVTRCTTRLIRVHVSDKGRRLELVPSLSLRMPLAAVPSCGEYFRRKSGNRSITGCLAFEAVPQMRSR